MSVQACPSCGERNDVSMFLHGSWTRCQSCAFRIQVNHGGPRSVQPPPLPKRQVLAPKNRGEARSPVPPTRGEKRSTGLLGTLPPDLQFNKTEISPPAFDSERSSRPAGRRGLLKEQGKEGQSREGRGSNSPPEQANPSGFRQTSRTGGQTARSASHSSSPRLSSSQQSSVNPDNRAVNPDGSVSSGSPTPKTRQRPEHGVEHAKPEAPSAPTPIPAPDRREQQESLPSRRFSQASPDLSESSGSLDTSKSPKISDFSDSSDSPHPRTSQSSDSSGSAEPSAAFSAASEQQAQNIAKNENGNSTQLSDSAGAEPSALGLHVQEPEQSPGPGFHFGLPAELGMEPAWLSEVEESRSSDAGDQPEEAKSSAGTRAESSAELGVKAAVGSAESAESSNETAPQKSRLHVPPHLKQRLARQAQVADDALQRRSEESASPAQDDAALSAAEDFSRAEARAGLESGERDVSRLESASTEGQASAEREQQAVARVQAVVREQAALRERVAEETRSSDRARSVDGNRSLDGNQSLDRDPSPEDSETGDSEHSSPKHAPFAEDSGQAQPDFTAPHSKGSDSYHPRNFEWAWDGLPPDDAQDGALATGSDAESGPSHSPEEREDLSPTPPSAPLAGEDSHGHAQAQLPSTSPERIAPYTPAGVHQGPPDIPGYHCEALLGRGGMGEVWRARQVSLNRPVAVKLLSPSLAVEPDFIRRFERESNALAALSHPNVVSVIDRGSVNGVWYFVMELVEGRSLRERMSAHQSDPSELLKLIAQVARTVDFAHQRGVIHRDLKPENVLIDLAGNVKVADFGLAGMSELGRSDLTMTAVAMGTAHYMAPEQRRDAKNVDGRADLYSLGVILYESLTGELPVGRFPSPREMNRELDPRLEAVTLRLLEPEPGRRPSRGLEVAEIIDEVLAESEKPLLPPPPTLANSRPRSISQLFDASQGKSVARWMLAVVTIVLVSVLAVAFRSSEPKPPSFEAVELPALAKIEGDRAEIRFGEGDEAALIANGGAWSVGEEGQLLRESGVWQAPRDPRAVLKNLELDLSNATLEVDLKVTPVPGAADAPRAEVVLYLNAENHVGIRMGLEEDAGFVLFSTAPVKGEVRSSTTPGSGVAMPKAGQELRLAVMTVNGRATALVDGHPVASARIAGLDGLKAHPSLSCKGALCSFSNLRVSGKLQPLELTDTNAAPEKSSEAR